MLSFAGETPTSEGRCKPVQLTLQRKLPRRSARYHSRDQLPDGCIKNETRHQDPECVMSIRGGGGGG